jgi:asparagine synthase (glutamine-hydrolysing)
VCGIVGFVQRAPLGSGERDILSPMLARIVRRGPDGEGRWAGRHGEWSVALGHRRLAIIDLQGGAQPMSTPEGDATITYNGELYNFRDLRRPLEQRGIAFRTRSDAEVLLRHVATRGAEGLPDLDGMFAFALWDARTGGLLLARDRAGIKPLYYATLADGGLVFASELTALLQHPGAPRRLSARGLQSYFFSDYFHPPHTLVEGVRKLAPGEYVKWKDGRLGEATRFWRVRFDAPPGGTVEELAGRTWAHLDRAVERQLMSDVPLGVFLSGGIDSSSVATLAQRRSGSRLKTFTIAFEDPTFDESAHARLVADAIGSEHVEERLSVANVLDVVDVALERLDEPLADPSLLPTFLLSRLASRHVKVVLGGDGGDELFGGYPTYQAHLWARYARWLPLRAASVRRAVDGLRESDRYQSLGWKAKRFVLRWDADPMRRHLRWMSNLDLDDLRQGLPTTAHDIPAPLDETFPSSPGGLNAVLALDFATYLSGSVLTKVDRASMAHGLEVRPPLLDNEMIDWAFSLPSSLKLRRGATKYLLRRAARGHLPERIVRRAKKGFGIPLGAWLRGPMRDRLTRALEPSALWDTGLLDRSTFQRWAAMHRERRGDHSKALWALIVLDAWVRREGVYRR